MQKYILRRLLLLIPTLLGITMLVFGMVRFLPGDAVTMMMADYAGYAKDEDELRAKLGLDKPMHEQYVAWLWGAVRGDFGNSLRNQTPVMDDLRQKMPVTFQLGFMGLLISLSIALPLGVFSAVKQDTTSDYAARSLAIAALAVPGFWLGTLAITLPSIWWAWAPPLRYTQFVDDPGKNLSQMILPAVILGIGLSGTLMRLTRAQMLEILRQDYVRTARSKGLAEGAVIFVHALRNAIIPVVTILGLQLTAMVSGTVVLESIFVVPGMGRHLLDAINYRDYPIVQAVTLIFAVLIVVSNLAVDIVYAWLDPRIRYS